MASKPEASQATTQPGCGVFGRYPLMSLLVCASLGLACGFGLSAWDDEGDSKEKLIKWIGLLGDLFVRALKCLVLPLIFVSITLAVLEMMAVGRAGSVGWKTIACYLSTTFIASIIGIISIVVFRSTFSEGEFAAKPPPTFEFGCSGDGMVLTESGDGSVSCDASNGTMSQFIVNDVNGYFMSGSGGPSAGVSMSDTVYDGIFLKIVPSNIFVEFTDANFAAIVFFAVAFAVGINQVYLVNDSTVPKEEGETIIRFFKALDKIFLKMIQWVIMLTPFAVFSLITQAIGSQDDIAAAFNNVGYLVAAFIVGIIAQFLIVHVVIFYLVTKRNPFGYLKHIVPAQTMAFACASSAATVPVTLKSVRSVGWVPEPILRFVVPLGATVNMDGSAIYYPMASVWLAYLNGIEPTAADMILLLILGSLGSIGAAPVPYSSLVLIVSATFVGTRFISKTPCFVSPKITAYNTVFGGDAVPEGVAFLAGIDWFIGMLRTVTNVTGDAVVCGLVAHLCPIEDHTEMEGVMNAANLDAAKADDDDVVLKVSSSDNTAKENAEAGC